MKAGDVLLLNDGLIVMTVEAVRGDAVHTIVKLGGELSNNKGINKQGGGLTAPALTAKDMEDIKTAMSFQADYVAVSFPKNATDMEMARQLCNVAAAQYGHKPGLIAKIERAEAIPAWKRSSRCPTASWLPVATWPWKWVTLPCPHCKEDDPHGARHGQGGDHRDPDDGVHDHQPRAHPRRSQRRGQCRAGRHRCRDAERGNRCRQVPAGNRAGDGRHLRRSRSRRRSRQDADFSNSPFKRTDQAIAIGALFTAHHLGAKAIVAMTDSGSTALWMSRHRIHIPIYALTPRLATQRKMALYRNVRPLLMDTSADRDTALDQAKTHLLMRGIVQSGDVRHHLRRAHGPARWYEHAEDLQGGVISPEALRAFYALRAGGDNTFAARRLLLGVSEVGHASFRQKGCQRLCIKRWQLLFW